MARGKAYDDGQKAQVIAALMTGQGVREVSRALNVPLSTVSRLKKELAPMVREAAVNLDARSDEEAAENGFGEAFQGEDVEDDIARVMPEVGTQKKALPELVAELLTTNVETLSTIAHFVRRPAYLDQQGAESLAVLYGVIADKTIRILEAHAAAQPLEKP